ncbi:MAG: hypothetical protein U1E36_08420 [Rickettsiales bacterium]
MLYSWQDADSLIKEVELFKIGEQQEAFIYAPLGADKDKLSTITDGLRQRGFQAIPDITEGRHVLRVEKFTNREHLFDALRGIGAINGTPHTQITKRDPQSKNLNQRLKESTMTMSGWLFTVGDALMILSGALRKDYAEAGTGFIWGSTGVVLALFGKKKPENQLSSFYRKLEEHLRQEGIPMPKNERDLVDALKRDNGMITRVVEFLENNPADFHHVVQSIGGTTLIKAGYNQGNWYKAAAGGFVSVGQAMGVLLPDKAHQRDAADPVYKMHDVQQGVSIPAEANQNSANQNSPSVSSGALPPEPDNRGAVTKTWEWFTSNPLHFSGLFPFINNVLNITGAYRFEKPRVDADIAKVSGEKSTVRGKEYDGLELEYLKDDIRKVSATEKITTTSFDGGVPKSEFAQGLMKGPTDQKSIRDKLIEEENRLEKVAGIGKKKDFIQIGKRRWRAYEMNLATSGLYIAANLLYAVSKKDTSTDLKAVGVIDEMTGILANIVVAAPDHMQSELTHQMAGYLGTQPDVKLTIQDIDKMISEKVASLRETPWENKKKSNAVTNPVHMGPLVASNQNVTLQPGVA